MDVWPSFEFRTIFNDSDVDEVSDVEDIAVLE